MANANQIDVVYAWCGYPATDICKPSPELEWSILSVRKYMPWIRNIIVTVSDAFDESMIKSSNINNINIQGPIRWVKESEFVPKKYLPTFNSNVVESWIWKIKGLSDCFIYMNDDMYIGQPVDVSTFFVQDRVPVLRLDSGPTHHPTLAKLNEAKVTIPYSRMWGNAVSMYGLDFTRMAHQVQPQRVSLMAKFYKKYKKEVDTSSFNKTRAGEGDFNLLRFSSALAVMSGESVMKVTGPQTKQDFFVESDDYANISRIPKMRPQFFCINNNGAENKRVFAMLKRYYAKP